MQVRIRKGLNIKAFDVLIRDSNQNIKSLYLSTTESI